MRKIVVSESEEWLIPDANTIYPAFDLFVEHLDTTKDDGFIDSCTIAGKLYKAPFYNEKSVFNFGDIAKFNPLPVRVVTVAGYSVNLWYGVSRHGGNLPEFLFKGASYPISIFPVKTYFNVKIGNTITQYSDLKSITINVGETLENYASVWLSDTNGSEEPEGAKRIRLLERCDDYKDFTFLNLSGETRVASLNEKRKAATFKETMNYLTTDTIPTTSNRKTYEVSVGENELTTTYFIEGLQKNELDEISQLAVSPYILIDGLRCKVMSSKSVVYSGNEKGGVFFVEVKKAND